MKQRGFAIVAALFLVVVIALLGAFMLSISNAGNIASVRDLEGVRAYRAARMGMEWAASAICNGNGCSTPLTACPTLPASLDTSPDGFTVVVTCSVSTFNESDTNGDLPRYIFKVTSTASKGGSPGSIGWVERSFSGYFEFPS